MNLTYGKYLKIRELLELQQPLSEGPEHDETLFIIIHQVYELWFKQQMHECRHLCSQLGADDLSGASATLKRMLTILKTMVAQIDVLETMTPIGFLSFRARLESASGFQSWQFRAFESALGKREGGVLERYPEGGPERAAITAARAEHSLWQAFLGMLARHVEGVPAELIAAPAASTTVADARVQEKLLHAYRASPAVRSICELLVDLDEGIQEWRYRHVKMVERTIGFRTGTGGSSGADYLRTTLFRPLFPDLWEIRTRL